MKELSSNIFLDISYYKLDMIPIRGIMTLNKIIPTMTDKTATRVGSIILIKCVILSFVS